MAVPYALVDHFEDVCLPSICPFFKIIVPPLHCTAIKSLFSDRTNDNVFPFKSKTTSVSITNVFFKLTSSVKVTTLPLIEMAFPKAELKPVVEETVPPAPSTAAPASNANKLTKTIIKTVIHLFFLSFFISFSIFPLESLFLFFRKENLFLPNVFSICS